MSQVPIERRLFDKDMFGKVVDTSFSQLLNNQVIQEPPSFTIDDFFTLYEQLFYQIPKEGDTGSHRYILEKEANYLGVIINQEDIQALLNEITFLRQQLLDTQTIVSTLQLTTKTTGV